MLRFWYLPFLLIGGYFVSMSSKNVPVTLNQARLIVSELRGGDFTHAGDTEAIDMVLAKLKADFPEVLKGNCLDVGCGFGGTADYLVKQGVEKIWGIDINKPALDYAKSKYKSVNCLNLDAFAVSTQFDRKFFSLVYLFNVLYAIEDKVSVLKQLAMVSKPGAILMLFDYSAGDNGDPVLDLAGATMHPIQTNKIEQQLKEAGWEIVEKNDLSSEFVVWYEKLIQKLSVKEQELKGNYLAEDISKVFLTYSHILNQLRLKKMGGVLIYAKRV
jgi:2-polyprenyl-3-methyl-5-hydroxy-6-metoxy-1,4-benzoquinol methylase